MSEAQVIDRLAAIAPSATFTHQPRPPGIPGSIPDKRDYLNHHSLGVADYCAGYGIDALTDLTLFVQVNRYSPCKLGTVRIATECGSMSAQIRLTPNSLRELARMCIDAAHDIEVNP